MKDGTCGGASAWGVTVCLHLLRGITVFTTEVHSQSSDHLQKDPRPSLLLSPPLLRNVGTTLDATRV